MDTNSLREPTNLTLVATLPELVVNHTLNCCFGIVFGFFNIPLCIVLMSSKAFRQRYFVLIFLCLADSTNCLAISLMGLNRVLMYSEVIETMSLPVRNSWDCAMEPWIWLRGIGDLWPPMVQILIGIERCLAVFSPWFYSHIEGTPLRILMMVFSILYVAGVVAYGFIQSWSNRDLRVAYYCGRKAAFSNEYGRYIYFSNILCYTFGCFVCLCAYIKCRKLKEIQSANQNRVRYTLVISVISTLLVSIPNAISLLKAWIPIADIIAKPSVYASSVNSGLNFFIYLTLNQEFRERFCEIFGIRRQSNSVAIMEYSFTRTRSHHS